MQTCWKCGKTYDDDANFCKACGSPSKSEKICWKCGAKLSEDSKFCAKCGESFDKAEQTVKPIKESNEVLERFDYSYEAVGAKKKEVIKTLIIMIIEIILSVLIINYCNSFLDKPVSKYDDMYESIKSMKNIATVAVILLPIFNIISIIANIALTSHLESNKLLLRTDKIEGIDENGKSFHVKYEKIQNVRTANKAENYPRGNFMDRFIPEFAWVCCLQINTTTDTYRCYCRTPDDAVIKLNEQIEKVYNTSNMSSSDRLFKGAVRIPAKSGDSWICKKCKAPNPNSSLYCRDCGEYK